MALPNHYPFDCPYHYPFHYTYHCPYHYPFHYTYYCPYHYPYYNCCYHCHYPFYSLPVAIIATNTVVHRYYKVVPVATTTYATSSKATNSQILTKRMNAAEPSNVRPVFKISIFWRIQIRTKFRLPLKTIRQEPLQVLVDIWIGSQSCQNGFENQPTLVFSWPQ